VIGLLVAAGVIVALVASSGGGGGSGATTAAHRPKHAPSHDLARTAIALPSIASTPAPGGIVVRGPIALTTGGTPGGVVVGPGGDAWVTDTTDNLLVLVRADGSELRTPVGRAPVSVALDRRNGNLWVVNRDSGDVTVVDENGNYVRRSIVVGSQPSAIAIGYHAAWVADSGESTVTRIGLDDFSATHIPVGAAPTAVETYDKRVWVALRDGSVKVLSAIDATNDGAVPRLLAAGVPVALATTPPDIWVVREAAGGLGGLTGIDSRTSTAARTNKPYVYRAFLPTGAFAGYDPRDVTTLGGGGRDNTIWVISTYDHRLNRIDTSNPGHLRVLASIYTVGEKPERLEHR
jgi:YVTN family beta-propeller protein